MRPAAISLARVGKPPPGPPDPQVSAVPSPTPRKWPTQVPAKPIPLLPDLLAVCYNPATRSHAARNRVHAVSPEGEPVGVVRAALGTIEQLGIADLIDTDKRPHGLVCECPLIAVTPGAPEGTTELLYRSVYVFARRHGADSLVASVDPMTLDIFREEYGIMFRALGPVQDHLGFDALPVGEELTTLESGLRIYRPDFYEFLTEPFTDNERNRFGIPLIARSD